MYHSVLSGYDFSKILPYNQIEASENGMFDSSWLNFKIVYVGPSGHFVSNCLCVPFGTFLYL